MVGKKVKEMKSCSESMKSFEKHYKDHGSVKFGVIIPFPRGRPKITFKATLS